MTNFKEFETKRLVLKHISMTDREFIYKQFSNEQVNRYLFDAEPTATMKEAEKIIEFYTQPEPRLWQRWIMIEKETGLPVGTCGFHNWSPNEKVCEIGYDVNPEFWRKGYAKEAIEKLLDFAKNEMKVTTVRACIYPENQASVGIAEKFGFTFNGKVKEEIFRGKSYLHKIFELNME